MRQSEQSYFREAGTQETLNINHYYYSILLFIYLLIHLSNHFFLNPYGGSDNSLLSHPLQSPLCSALFPRRVTSTDRLRIPHPLASIWVWSMAGSSGRFVVGEEVGVWIFPNPSSCYSSQSEWFTLWQLFSKSCLPAASVSPGSLLEMQSLRSYSRSTGVMGILMHPQWLWYLMEHETLINSYRLFWLAPLHGFISKTPEINILPLAPQALVWWFLAIAKL